VIHTEILLSLLSVSVKMTALPQATVTVTAEFAPTPPSAAGSAGSGDQRRLRADFRPCGGGAGVDAWVTEIDGK
jgi:hypothetical protein